VEVCWKTDTVESAKGKENRKLGIRLKILACQIRVTAGADQPLHRHYLLQKECLANEEGNLVEADNYSPLLFFE